MKISGIISIHPKYALGIVLGIKHIEWRKKRSFDDLNFFVNEKKPLYMLLYLTSPIKSTSLLIELSDIEIGNPIDIFNKNSSIAGITLLDIIEYYNKKLIDFEMVYGTRSIDTEIVSEIAYALHIKHCFLINPSISKEINENLITMKLKVFKGLCSVQKHISYIDKNQTEKIW